MPAYTYRARTMDGAERTGVREASDVATLGHALREEGLLLVEAHAEGEKKKKGINISLPFAGRIKVVDRMLVTRHLAVLIEAGVDLPKALTTVAKQTGNAKFKVVLAQISDEIRQGRKFSEILAGHPKVFEEVYVSMVAAGEESGKLVETLRVLAGQLQKQHKLQSKVQGAMMYPMVVVFALLLIGTAMIVYVVPQLEGVFGDMGADLPLQTKAIFWLSHALIDWWYLFIIGTIVFGVVVWKTLTNKKVRKKLDRLFMRAPVIGVLIRQVASAKLARTLSSLISSGVPIVRTLEITSRVVGNEAFRESLVDAMETVERGTSLHESMAAHADVYPPLVIEMAAVGEESGKLSDVFEELADFYEEEVDTQLGSLSSIIEPVMMLVIGGIVGFFVISLMSPMYTVIGSI